MPTTPTTCPVSFHDLVDDLADLGFLPFEGAETDGIFPNWVTTWRTENRVAVALSQPSDRVVIVSEYRDDDRWAVGVTDRNGVEFGSWSFPITRTGATLMLALLAAAVKL